MKSKFLIGLLLVSLMLSVVIVADAPDLGIDGADVENLEETIDTYSPLNDEGEFEPEKYKPFVSKAEQRIDNINLWLEDNASWLSAIFGMVPALSWLFAINLYLILLFLVILVFNGNAILDIFEVLGAKVDLMFFETHWSNVFGFGVFATLLVTKVFVLLAKFLLDLLGILWNYILPWGLAIAVIIIVLIVIGGFAGIVVCRQILIAIGQAIKKRKEKKRAEKTKGNEEVLETIVKGATGDF
ncbi:MAG: hypothetical protein KKF50_01450 [Nanoarchaeota archaeon]|nr:hypothetical protein [Nanoarchaeota archaeon]